MQKAQGSLHQFMFPFKFTNEGFDKSKWEKTHPQWIRQTKSGKCSDYGLNKYFHDKAVRLLWEDASIVRSLCISSYVYNMQSGSYNIFIDRENWGAREQHHYSLDLMQDGVKLYLLSEVGIGILCFTMNNTRHTEDEDVLKINQWGRRIYRPFLECPESCMDHDENQKKDCKELPESRVCKAKCCECAEALSLILKIDETKSIEMKEDFQIWNREDGKGGPRYAKFILELLEGFAGVKHIIDDRMFCSCYHKSKIAEELNRAWAKYSNHPGQTKTDESSASPSSKDVTAQRMMQIIDYWYRLCYVDIGISCHSEKMKHDLLQRITYDRWGGYGTFYGITKYSFIGFAGLGAPDMLREHFLRQYHYLILIMLIQRSCLIHFANEVNNMSDKHLKLGEGRNVKDVISFSNELNKFRKQYILFIDNVWFDEVTPQEQGIEMYALGKSVLELEKHKDAIRCDIEEFYQFSKSEMQERQSELLNRLSEIGAILLPLGVWNALVSIDIHPLFPFLGDVGLFGFSAFLLTLMKNKKSMLIVFVIYMCMAVVHGSLTLLPI